MKRKPTPLICIFWLALSVAPIHSQQSEKSKPNTVEFCALCVRKNLAYLASDAMRGRGSATEDEHRAAVYIVARLKAYGIAPAGDDGGYLQRAPLSSQAVIRPPQLKIAGNEVSFTHGKEMVVMSLFGDAKGPLQKLAPGSEDSAKQGAVVFLDLKGKDPGRAVNAVFSRGAAVVVLPEHPRLRRRWQQLATKLPKLPPMLKDSSEEGPGFNLVGLSAKATAQMQEIPDGTEIHFSVPLSKGKPTYTWNALGKIVGRDPKLQHAAVLFSAHLDHLGVGKPVNGDSIYNGADDDASGTVAVLELARVLGKGPKPRRTVIFALFGSEEIGGLGSTYFREHPPVPLQEIAVNLEFEMIGRSDPAVKADTVWLTGWERSNLGPALAEHGAHIVGDPHPEENFFARSDNFVLAKKGVVAQTISSYGLHKQYHQPNDDLAHIDFKHMNAAIGSLLGPVRWLVDSDFVPDWNPGGKP